MENNTVELGTVKFYNRDSGFGYVIPDMVDGDVRIEKACGPLFLEAGIDGPVFTDRIIDTKPVKGERLVFVRGEGWRSMLTAVKFSYAALYEAKAAQIAQRPQFRVLRRTRLHGVWSEWSSVFEGSALKLASISCRDGQRISSVDQFAPTFWTGTFVTENRFQIWDEREGFVDYPNDPRPFLQDGKRYRFMLFKDGDVRQIAFGTMEELMWSYPRGIPHDYLAPTDPKSDYELLYCESREKDGWVPCEDPRKMPFVIPDCSSVCGTKNVSAQAVSATTVSR